ncbi:MAG TPA: hypothetical protein ENG71_04680 [Thermoplasmatales archaeon]|nr:hypothetical protein [Thermoplasmatales archaeon]
MELKNMIDFLSILIASIIGSFLGILTGLIPGLHTNNLAILFLFLSSLYPANLFFCILLVSASIAHTFLNIIPSTFIGAPEEDTALVILPAHSMLLEGRGYEAVCISALASLSAIIISFFLLIPVKLILGKPINLYYAIEVLVPYILLLISIILIFTSENRLNALFIFLLSGLFGFVILNIDVSFLFPSSPLFPALAGLFGVPALVYSYKQILPPQNLEEKSITIKGKDVAGGVMAGGLVSILPGVSSAVATILALLFRKEKQKENTISILSSANTATNFFVLAMLFIILKARSGFAIAIGNMVKIEKWDGLLFPYPFNLFLIAIIISSIISYYSTKFIGRIVAKNISEISYSLLLKLSLAIILAMVFIFAGPMGLFILFIASSIGILCLRMKVRRSLCMGVLLLPLILNYFLPFL